MGRGVWKEMKENINIGKARDRVGLDQTVRWEHAEKLGGVE